MEIIRENKWVKVWDTAGGLYLDSKYRTYECELSADEAILAWRNANAEQRDDIEAALEFFPCQRGIRRVAIFLTAFSGEEVGERITERWFGPSRAPRPETARFLEAFTAEPSFVRRTICETPWFVASWDGISYHFVTDGKRADTPTYRDFCREYTKAHSRLYRDLLTRFWGLEREV